MTAAFGAIVALNTAIARICTALISGLLGVMVAMMLSVIMRHVLASPLSWSEDLSLICLVWMTLLGLAAGMRAERRAIDGVERALPGPVARLVNLTVHGAALLFAIPRAASEEGRLFLTRCWNSTARSAAPAAFPRGACGHPAGGPGAFGHPRRPTGQPHPKHEPYRQHAGRREAFQPGRLSIQTVSRVMTRQSQT